MKAFHIDSIDSTNEAAKRMIRAGEIDGDAYVAAREQTAGRGSRGRTWLSPRDAGIYVSVVCVPRPAPTADSVDLTFFTLAAGVACSDFLVRLGADVQLKPVNDIMANGRKLGGILTEALIEQGALQAVIIGVGVNLRPAERHLRDGGVQPICLVECIGEDITPDAATVVTAGLARHVLSWVQAALAGQSEEIRSGWLARAVPGARLPDPPGMT